MNSAPLAGSLAAAPHLAAVQLDQPLHQRQPEPQPAAAAVERPVGLGERLEEPRQHLRRDARAGVAHAHDGLLPHARRLLT